MGTGYTADLEKLVCCVASMAAAMGVEAPERDQAARFLDNLVHGARNVGGRQILLCLEDRLITEVEARNLLMAHVATWVSHQNRVEEPSYDLYTSPELELQFEVALLGRPARRTRHEL
jgi:hypothetical protein